MTKVSIITPSYNAARFIKDCIQSVICQSFENWELLIVDDYSKDNSVEIITKYTQEDDRIQLIALNENVGAAAARNIAIRKAKEDLLLF